MKNNYKKRRNESLVSQAITCPKSHEHAAIVKEILKRMERHAEVDNLTISIDIGNDAFVDNPSAELVRVLERVTNKCNGAEELSHLDGLTAYDSNGNTVARVTVRN